MGCVCGNYSNEEEKQNLLVQHELIAEQNRDDTEKKLLLLGAGGSGKSTFFKQLQVIHGNGFPDRERLQYKKHVHHQVIQQMKKLIERSYELPERYPEAPPVGDEASEAAHKMSYVREDSEVNETIGEHIDILWKDVGIRATFEKRAEFAIFDSSEYFFDHIRRISARAYIPTTMDILMVRHLTTGVTERTFLIKQHTFRIVDVGGQRSERKKWIHCFAGVTAVIFVAALSGYDEVTYEDEHKIVIRDSLDLFDEICNSPWFENTSMLLFLNKSDLFKEKIKQKPITCCFDDYEGDPKSARESLRFIRKTFENKNRNPNKRVYTHVTCAIDKQNVDRIFSDVQHVVITNSLQRGALL